MIAALHRLIAAPETHRQLVELAAGAPASAMLSLRRPCPAPGPTGSPCCRENSPGGTPRPPATANIAAIGQPCCNWSALAPTASPPSTTLATASAATGGAMALALAFAGFAFDTPQTSSPCPMPCSPFPACCPEAAMAACADTEHTAAAWRTIRRMADAGCTPATKG